MTKLVALGCASEKTKGQVPVTIPDGQFNGSGNPLYKTCT